MADFRYEATDRSGAFRTGFLTAGTIRQAIDQLEQEGLFVRRVEPVASREDAAEVTQFLEPLSEPSAANIAQILAETSSAALPLEPALRAAAQEAGRRERRVLLRIADDIAAGVPTDEAFVRAGEALPAHLLALILAGLDSGNLATVLSRYLTLTRQRARARRPLLFAIAYPVLLLIGAGLMFLLILLFLVPQFEVIFDDFGMTLPWMTEILISMSHFARSFWWPLLALLVFAGVLLLIYWLVMRGRRVTLSSLPVLDLGVRAQDWGRFCGLLSLLIESRQPLPQALRLAAAAATTLRVRGAGLAVAEDIEAGLTPWEAALPRTIPGPIKHVFRWGNRSDVFAEALAGLAEIYSRRSRVSAVLIGIVLEPFVLIFTAGTVGAAAVALFLPLFNLLNNLV